MNRPTKSRILASCANFHVQLKCRKKTSFRSVHNVNVKRYILARFVPITVCLLGVYFQPPCFFIGKLWETCDLTKNALESGQEASIVQIDFSAFDRVNLQGILCKLCSVGIVSSVFTIQTRFVSNRLQRFMVDGCRHKLFDVVSGVPMGNVLCPRYCSTCTPRSFSIMENKLIGYADDYFDSCCTIPAGVRRAVAESLNRDLGKVCELCDLWGFEIECE